MRKLTLENNFRPKKEYVLKKPLTYTNFLTLLKKPVLLLLSFMNLNIITFSVSLMLLTFQNEPFRTKCILLNKYSKRLLQILSLSILVLYFFFAIYCSKDFIGTISILYSFKFNLCSILIRLIFIINNRYPRILKILKLKPISYKKCKKFY